MSANANPPPFSGNDPFSAFWSDWWGKMAAAGAPAQPPPAAANDMAAAMRKAFFDAMAQQADQYMRSEAFLSAMKQTMDNALGWQQMLNQHLQKGVAGMQMPTRADSDHIVRLVRGMEDRLLGKLETMTQRVERLEKAAGITEPPPPRRKARPKRGKPASGSKS